MGRRDLHGTILKCNPCPDESMHGRTRWYLLGFLLLLTVPMAYAAGGGGGGGLDLPEYEDLPGWAIPTGVIILLIVYALIITEVIHRTLAAALGGIATVGALTVLVGDIPAIGAIAAYVDWDTIGLLFGMMVMVGILSHTGVFEWCAIQAYRYSGGSVWRLVVILCIVTAVLSAFLDNVTTMLLLTPVTIQLARVLDLKPVPILLAEVMFSNIGGTATMIGDPPNIIIGNGLSPSKIEDAGYPGLMDAGVTFIDFMVELAPGVIFVAIPSLIMMRYLLGADVAGRAERDIDDLASKYGIKDPALLKSAGSVLVVVILLFFAHPFVTVVHLSVAWIAVIGGVMMLLISSPHELEEPLEKVEWATLLFFVGLFVLVHGLQDLGVITWIGERVVQAIEAFGLGTEGTNTYGLVRFTMAIIIMLWVSAVVSAFIDNIPYTATMVPVVLIIADNVDFGVIGDLQALDALIWALAFGACLGGNGTLIGASANVVTAGMAEEAGYRITFNEFFKIGFPIMLLSTAIIMFYMVLVFVVAPVSAEGLGMEVGVAKTVMKLLLVALMVAAVGRKLALREDGQDWAEAITDHGLPDEVKDTVERLTGIDLSGEGAIVTESE